MFIDYPEDPEIARIREDKRAWVQYPDHLVESPDRFVSRPQASEGSGDFLRDGTRGGSDVRFRYG